MKTFTTGHPKSKVDLLRQSRKLTGKEKKLSSVVWDNTSDSLTLTLHFTSFFLTAAFVSDVLTGKHQDLPHDSLMAGSACVVH